MGLGHREESQFSKVSIGPAAMVGKRASSAGSLLLLSPQGGRRPRELAGNRFLLLVGPEGGLDAEEVSAARLVGFADLSLGPRILRTETAGPAALAALAALHGDI